MGRRTLAIIILVIGILMFVTVVAFFLLNQGETPPDGQALDANGQPIDSQGVAPVEPPPGEPISSELDLEDTDSSFFQPVEGDQQMIEVVVSLQTVPRGWLMTEAELTTDLRLPEDVGNNVITDVQEAVGLYARSDIYQGQTLTKDILVRDLRQVAEEEVGPSSLIPPGFVAQAVPMDRLSGVAYGMSEGDYVDIMVSFVLKEIDPQFQTLLENSISFYLRDEEGNPIILVVDPYGRFEELPTGEKTHIAPSENPRRPILVSMILQNAKVIQVGEWYRKVQFKPRPPHPNPQQKIYRQTPPPQ
jgi:Flp pilus assembly protein CpaB